MYHYFFSIYYGYWQDRLFRRLPAAWGTAEQEYLATHTRCLWHRDGVECHRTARRALPIHGVPAKALCEQHYGEYLWNRAERDFCQTWYGKVVDWIDMTLWP